MNPVSTRIIYFGWWNVPSIVIWSTVGIKKHVRVFIDNKFSNSSQLVTLYLEKLLSVTSQRDFWKEICYTSRHISYWNKICSLKVSGTGFQNIKKFRPSQIFIRVKNFTIFIIFTFFVFSFPWKLRILTWATLFLNILDTYNKTVSRFTINSLNFLSISGLMNYWFHYVKKILKSLENTYVFLNVCV